MRIYLFNMRKSGMVIPKRALFDRFNAPIYGDLTISDKMDITLRRTIKIAELVKVTDKPEYNTSIFLYEPNILWINSGRFALAGFERRSSSDGVVEFAQSWLCMTELPQLKSETR